MKLMYIVLFTGLFSSYCAAQHSPENNTAKPIPKEAVKIEAESVKSQSKSVKTENVRPVEDGKTNPPVFFIINDKPVSKEEYLKHLANQQEQKKSVTDK